jgi:protein phosphatase
MGALRVGHFCLSDIGRRREENQDAWQADPAAGLFLVSDGMGGMAGGGVASKAVADILPKMVREKLTALSKRNSKTVQDALKETLAEFSAGLRDKAKENPQIEGMGATVVLALIEGRCLYLAHLGDSRAYLFAGGNLKRLTKDHSIVAVMLELGKITPEEAEVHPARHSMTRYAGMDGKAVADTRMLRLKGAERLLLCTDGLTNMLSDDKIRAALAEAEGPESACTRLVAEANEAGGADNVTALAVEFAKAA